ncbi:MAG: hypothetical protein EOO90_27250 [Pedobacter sp.]|nr:MAG: hypothetical protein EOO90_27250 [Pedobacter sp.]
MMNKAKPLLIEFGWLLLSAFITALILALMFGKEAFQQNLSINLHDTYFVTPSIPVYITLFIIVGFIIYYIKEFRKKFSRKTQNLTTIILGLLFIVALTRIGQAVSSFKVMEAASNMQNQNDSTAKGWKVYPPLPNLKKPVPESTVSLYTILEYLVILIQVIIASLLIKLGYGSGKWQRDKSVL